MLKYVNLIVMMALVVFAGCNNPSGGSSVPVNHTPGLAAPGAFSFSQIRSQDGDVTIRWTQSARVDKYSFFMGTSSSAITTPVTACSNTRLNYCALTGLDPNTVYYFSVTSTNAVGSKVVNNYGTALSVGTFDITSSSTGDGYIDLTWGASTNATSYNVIYGTRSGSYTGSVTNVTSPYHLTGLTNNVRYYVRVVAVNSQGGYGLSTSEANQLPFGPPAAPAGVTIAASPGQMVLNWNTTSGATTYKVFRGTTAGSHVEIANSITGTTYTDSTTTDGTQYYYVIKGYNGYDSPDSAEVTAKSISNFAMTSAAAGPGANQVTVSWPATAGGDTYDIYYGTNSSSLTSVVSGVTSPKTISSLTGGVPYYFKVLAKNAAGLGTTRYSTNQLSATPVALLAGPTGFTATATPGQVLLTWNAVAGATSYEVLRGTVSGTYSSLSSGILATTYTDSTVANGTAYYYVVRAYNGINGTYSVEKAVKPVASFAITGTTAVSSTSVQLTWGAAAGADNYDVMYGTVSGTYSSTAANVTSPYSVTGLSPNTTYYFVVKGRNAIGSGTAYITAQTSALTKTSAPSALTATATPGNIDLDWANTAGATTYNVYRGTASGTYTLLSGGVAVSNYSDTTVSDGTPYYYVVTADNGSESAYSTEVAAKSITAFAATSSTAPSPSTITVTWPATAGGDTFDIKYGTVSGTYTTTLTNKTSPYTITGLTGGTNYFIRVVAKNAVGAGTSLNASNELAQTTPVGPPVGMLATVATGQITVSWTAMTGASSYKIYRSTTSGSYGAALATGITGTNYVDTTVTDGTPYYYVVKSYNGADSADSSEVSGKTITPFSLTSVTAPTSTSIVVTFPSTTGGDVYDVRYGTTSGTYTTTLSAVTSPKTITGLTANTTYYIVARARNTVGSGASESTAELSIKTPVAVPTGLAATSSPGSVALTWTSVTNATSYNVYRGTVSGTTTLLQSGVATASYTDSTVTNGTTYYYAVTSDNGTESAKSTEVATQPIASHTITSLTSPSSTSLQVTWGAVTGATAYDVRYGTTSGTYTGTALNVTSPYTITGLTANTTYYVVVRAKNTVGAGTTLNSTEASLKTATSTPTGLTASAASGQVGLNWTATTGATTYNVYRGTVSGTTTLLASGVATNAYLDTTVTNGTTYYYAVTADNGSESAKSSEVAVRPIAAFTLTSVNAASSTSIDVTWPAAAGAATYDVRYGTSAGVYLGTVTNVTSPYTLTALSPNTTYYIIVRANNTVGAGTSINSNELNDKTATAAPTSLVATASASATANLSWTASSGATNYNIYRGTVSGTYAQIATGVSGTSYTDTTVVDGTTYFYAVRAYNGTESPNSNESSTRSIADFSIASTTAPTSTTIQVTWPATTGAATYDVKYGTTSGTYTTTLTSVTSPYTITGLASGTTYYIAVRAKNAIGGTASNQTAEVSQITPIGPPTGLAAVASPGSVALSWTAAGGASSYKVYRSTTSGSYGAALATGVTGTSYTDNTAANGTTYYYTLTAYNGADSAYATEVAVRPIATPVISSVTSPNSTSLTVTWGAAAGAATYDVRYGTATGSYTTTVAAATSPYTITGLTANTTYYVVVRANNAVGAGTTITSAESSKKTQTAAPTGLVTSATPGQVGLNWTATTGASTYNVYRSTSSGTETLLASGVATNAYLDTTVTNGTTYFYTVTADNGTESAQSSEVSVRPIASFSISALTALSATSLSVSWGAAAGAASYDVRYGTSSGVYLTTVSGVTSTYTLTGLTANTLYYVVVRANNAIGAGTSYTTSEMNVTTATAAPTTLVATASTGKIDLSWTAASGATNYRIYRGTTSGSYAQIASGVTGTTYSDTTVTNGTQYYYSVRSFNGIESVDSNEATGKSIASFTVAGTTSPSSTSIQVTWTAPAGGDFSDVRYGTSTGSYSTTASAVTSPYTITGLTANTTYYIVVRARNTIGSGSSVTTTEVTQKTATVAPTGLAATATPGSVALTWTATTGATSYNVYRGTSTGSYAQIASAVGTNSYTDSTVSNGTTYYYAVTASNGSESAYSNEATIRPIASFAIGSTTTISTTQVDVAWSAVAGAASYDVKYGTTSGTYTTTLTNQTSPVSLTGLSPGSTYYIVVIAKNAVGPGTSYQSAEVSAQTAFGAPGGVAVTATPGSAVITWSTVSGAATYKVFRSTSSGSYGAALATGLTSATYTDTTVANGTTYYYVVRAVTSGGADSPDSLEVSIRPISTFSLSSATPTSATSIDLVWTAATGAASYDVRYGTSTGSYTTTLTNQVSPLTVTGLTANTTYYFQVQAKNAVGTGTTVSSSELSAKTATAAPAGLTATATTGQIALSWTATTGATNYNVYRSTTSGSYGAALATAVAGTTYTDSTVTNGTTYYYVIKANNGILSAASTEASGQSIASFAITSVVPASTTSLTVTWPATAGAATYDVRYGTSTGSYTTTVTGQTSPYTITGLSSGTTYYVVVRANNAVGSGSSAQTAEVSQITPLAAPSGLAATSTPGSVALSWSAVGGASSYKVYRSTTSGSYGAALATGVTGTSYTDSTAVNGTQYFYVVTAYNGADSGVSNEATAKPIANFTISLSGVSSTSIQVSWTNPAGGATYDVRYGTATGSYATTITGQTTPYTITGLNPNTTYYVVVRANNAIGSGTSTTSTESSLKTVTATPTGLAAVASPASVALSWTAVSGATSYKVYRSTTSGSYGAALATPATNSYTDNTVSNGTTYYYVVVANNGADSAQSSEVSVQSISSFTFSALTAASSTSLDLTWTAATGAASYDVQYGTSTGSYSGSVTGVTSPYTLTGLTANTTYYVRVQAKNAIGAGTTVNSSELNAKTATAAPTGLAATSTAAGQISLSWTAATGASSYSVYRSTSSGTYGAALATGVATTTYTDSTVTDGTTYYYVVKATNGTLSAASNEGSAQSISSFTITTAALSSTSIQVTWPAATGATSYDVRYGTSTGSYSTTVTGQTSPYTITGLTSATTYYIVVKARNAVGGSAYTQSAEVSQITPVGAPTGVAAVASAGSVALSWSTVAGATSYKVFRSTTSGSYGAALATGIGGLTYTDSTAVNGTQYYYVVRAYNGADSANSTEVTAQPIANFTISLTGVSSTSIQVSWTNPAGGATYDVRYGTAAGSYSTTVTGQTSPYTITALNPNTTYYVVVRANNAIGSGTSTTSSESSIKTPTAAPTGLAATATPGSVALTWTAVTGATSYKVYRSTTSGSYGAALATGVGTNSYTDATAANGTTYFYTVVSNNGTDSVMSSEVTIQPISSFSLTAATTASSISINLTWGAATGATSYTVRYGTSTGVYLTTVPSVTSPYTLTGLTAGTRYYISIQASNAVGAGTIYNSNELNALTAVGAPAISLVATPGNVAVSWGAISGATNYNVYRGTVSGTYSQIASAVAGTSYNDNTITNGTQYFYVVRAYNGTESTNSNEATVQSIANFTLAAATINSSSSITLSWGAATGATTYDVRYGSSSGSYSTTVTGVTSPYTLTGLTAASLSYVVIRANNAVGSGTSNNSNEITARTATAAPTSLAATAGTGSVNLTWSAASGATNYNIYRGTSTGVYSLLTSAVAVTNYTDNTVTNGTTYYYVVRAYNGTESANSNEAVVTPIGSFSISSTSATTTTIQVAWGAAAGATAYDVKYGTTNGGPYGTTVTGQTSPYTITGLTSNTTYYIIVTARNGAGGSVNTAQASQITALAAPTGVAATGGSGSVNISWTAVSGATSYKVYRGTVSGSLSSLATGITGTSYNDTTAANGTTYYYAVLAYNGTDSALSSEVSKQPIAAPSISAVTGPSTTTIQVSWGAATGAATYDVQYGTTSGTYGTTFTSVTSPYTITGLTAGTTYYVRVVAKNAVGGGTTVYSTEGSGTPNSAPVISVIADQTVEANNALPVSFTLTDSNNPPSCTGFMSGSSSNTTVLPNAGIAFSGTAPNCTVTLTPANNQIGTTVVTLTATDGITPTSRTFNFTTFPCAVASIVWTTQPANIAAGNAFASAPKVTLKKADGSTCTTNFNPVSLDVSIDNSLQGDADITVGSASAVASGGVATFTGAGMTRAGTGYTLVASVDGILSPDSNTFNVTALAASKIVFDQQPLATPRSAVMIPYPVIQTTDTYGNYVTGSNVSVTMSLTPANNTEGATLGGTVTKTLSGGSATWNTLTVNTVGNYTLTATPASTYAAITSDPFDVMTVTPVNTVSVIDGLAGPMYHASGSNTYYRRAGSGLGTNFVDGSSITYYWEVVATNTSTSSATAILTRGTTSMATATIPASTSTPTLYRISFTSTTAGTSNNDLRFKMTGSNVTIYSSRIVAVQTAATKTQQYVPLTTIPQNNATAYLTITTPTYTALPAENSITFDWDPAEWDNLSTLQLDMGYQNVSGTFCVALFDKTANSQISGDLCGTTTSERQIVLAVDAVAMPATATQIEIRAKSSSSARLFRAGLMLRLVSLHNLKNFYRAHHGNAATTASTDIVQNRIYGYAGSYGTAVVTPSIGCTAKANTNGTGTFVLKDHGTNNSGTASATTISGSTITFSTQSSQTTLSNNISTTDGRRMYLNYTHTSGSFNVGNCTYIEEVAY